MTMKRIYMKQMMMKKRTNSLPGPGPRTTTPNNSRLRTRVASALLACTFALPAAAVLQPMPMYAQRGPVQRVAEGTVLNKDGALIKGAVVYLKDTKSLSVNS